jgi:hypothetical protein
MLRIEMFRASTYDHLCPTQVPYLPQQTHIADPNERRRMALAEVDKAPFGWYHVRLAVVTGIGFFTDAYSVCVTQAATSNVSDMT